MCYPPERMTDKTIRRSGAISMLMKSERRPAIRTMRGWAIDVLQEAGAIRKCEEHGWMQDRASRDVLVPAPKCDRMPAAPPRGRSTALAFGGM